MNAMPPRSGPPPSNGHGGAAFQRWQPGGNPATYNYGVGQRDPSTDILDFDWPDAIASQRDRPPPSRAAGQHPFAPNLVPVHQTSTSSASYGSGFASSSRNQGGTSDDWLDFVATMAPPSQPPPHANGQASSRPISISMSRGGAINQTRRSASPVGNTSTQIASVRRGASGGSGAQRPRRRSASSMSSISGHGSHSGNGNVDMG